MKRSYVRLEKMFIYVRIYELNEYDGLTHIIRSQKYSYFTKIITYHETDTAILLNQKNNFVTEFEPAKYTDLEAVRS